MNLSDFFTILRFPWLSIVWVIASGFLTSAGASLYLHRSVTHTAVKFVVGIEYIFRFWLWMATGMNTREWVACHRKHHAFADKPGDPHSPVLEGLSAVLWGGVFLYRKAIKDPELIKKYGHGCPNDWIERNIFSKFRLGGIALLIIINVLVWGLFWGAIAWSCQALWMIALGHLINGAGHAVGYRNTEVKDSSTNIVRVGSVGLGEELHNNHHANMTSAKFSQKKNEYDPGWGIILVLTWLRLAKIKKYTITKDVKWYGLRILQFLGFKNAANSV